MTNREPTAAEVVAEDEDQQNCHPEESRGDEELSHGAGLFDMHEKENHEGTSMTAMVMATMKLYSPSSTLETATVVIVSTIRVRKTPTSIFIGTT